MQNWTHVVVFGVEYSREEARELFNDTNGCGEVKFINKNN